MMPRLIRLFHTGRHLKPVQVVGRLRMRYTKPRPDTRPHPPLRARTRDWHARCLREASLLGPTRFRFLNEERDLRWPHAWTDPSIPILWLFNLHYFDDLHARDSGLREERALRGLIQDWIQGNPPGVEPGWDPYVISARVVNWIKWALRGRRLPDGVLDNLSIQTRYLANRLEYSLLGNHLLTNAKALVFAGLFFSGTEADGWLRTGLGILRKQLPEQILRDGGHFELSPMYHSLSCWRICWTYCNSPACTKACARKPFARRG